MATATVHADGKIVISRARASFTDSLFTAAGFTDPKTGKTSEPKHNITFLVDRTDPSFRKVIEAEEDRVAKEKWQGKATAIMAEIRANNRGAIKPGELKASYDGYEGSDFIAANNDVRPTLVQRNGKKIEQDGVIYAGCYVLGHITLWAQDNSWGKRINANVTGVQFLEDGDSFGGGAPPSNPDDFSNLSAEDPIESMVD